jgi:hypothetical protein
LRKAVGFLTASGFVSAILLVWGQQWVGGIAAGELDWSSGLGLAWTLVAVLLSLTSSMIALYNYLRADDKEAQVPVRAMYLLAIAFGMAIVDVAQSLCKVLIFLITGYQKMPLWVESLGPAMSVERIFYIAAAAVFVIICIISIVAVKRAAKPLWFS